MSTVVRTVSEERLKAIMTHLLVAVSVPQEDADRCAYIYWTASVRGIDTHGIRLLPGNIRRILGGAINPRPSILEVANAGALVILDGDRGLGPVVGAVAMDRAIGVARRNGIGCAVARNSNHYGASGAFVMRAIDAGMMGISFSNCGQMMTIEGTTSRTIGNNPIAIGAPGPDFPMVLDMATSVASLGRIGMRRRDGKPLPDEWVVQETDRTRDLILRHFGGAKGSGLAIMLEVLSGVLSGAGAHRLLNYNAREESDGAAHTQIAIDTDLVQSRDRYDEHMRELVARLKSAECAPGVNEVRLPGERAWRETLERRQNGIPIDDDTAKALDGIATEIGTAVPWA